MSAKTFLPVLAIGAGALFLLGTKKKKDKGNGKPVPGDSVPGEHFYPDPMPSEPDDWSMGAINRLEGAASPTDDPQNFLTYRIYEVASLEPGFSNEFVFAVNDPEKCAGNLPECPFGYYISESRFSTVGEAEDAVLLYIGG